MSGPYWYDGKYNEEKCKPTPPAQTELENKLAELKNENDKLRKENENLRKTIYKFEAD